MKLKWLKQKKLILVKLIGIGNYDSSASEYNPGHVKLDWLSPYKVDRVNENDSKEKEGYIYNEDKCNNKDNDDDDSDKIDWDW